MKIALLGSAPSSLRLAPFGDPSFEIWACSPGCYPVLARVNEFFEVHRWEPGVVGQPGTQKPWFTPEYVQWLKTVPPRVWVADPAAQKDIGYPRAQLLPWRDLIKKYGHYLWTSSLAYMSAMAIDRILAERERRKAAGEPAEEDVIGYYGVDMAANDEQYSGQRSACQTFIQMLVALDIRVEIPPESDLATPPPMYGVSEVFHKSIKNLERMRELEVRLAQTEQQAMGASQHAYFLKGAIDDLRYHQSMWSFGEDVDTLGVDYKSIFQDGTVAPAVTVMPAHGTDGLAALMGEAKARLNAANKKKAKKSPAKKKAKPKRRR